MPVCNIKENKVLFVYSVLLEGIDAIAHSN